MASRHSLSVWLTVYLFVSCWLAAPSLASSSLPGEEDLIEPSTAQLLRDAHHRFGPKEKKYRALVDKVAKAVEQSLGETLWSNGSSAKEQEPLGHHPWLAHVQSLAETTRANAKGRKNSKQTLALLERHPWNAELEFLLGLAYGSERAVPDHKDGFIDLGQSSIPPPGFPDLLTNHYLYGLQEIVSWQYGVQTRKGLAYQGRNLKKRPALLMSLPPWERLRIYLMGSTPETALFAIPQLTHQIHSRLAEIRRTAQGALVPMDDFLTLFDSKWNGFSFEIPESGERVSFVIPVHWLFTDGKGFVFQFPRAQEIAADGDIPFFAIQTFEHFAARTMGEALDAGDFIASTPKAREARDEFTRIQRSLSRCKALIDLFVRAILAPNLRFPAYLSAYDYPAGHYPRGCPFPCEF